MAKGFGKPPLTGSRNGDKRNNPKAMDASRKKRGGKMPSLKKGGRHG